MLIIEFAAGLADLRRMTLLQELTKFVKMRGPIMVVRELLSEFVLSELQTYSQLLRSSKWTFLLGI